ncbi:hypothetical protein J31TS4_37380 [Paenibacillus sp. J31TS4]|uniref:sensor histidine kinase n=1 Tax=Paenibacillus sp. J31TS4 TaxID=2807195 RepID=UPI001B0D96C4|nr:HAMP domain-containing sensor histidine kinase [Paenibacillus sp. J31TS4]GIP40458.1 hypothetical protein J31TS4_37380 [Paenibacillus sp. J31TS4]
MRRPRLRFRFRLLRSLLSKYVLIILLALVFLPVAIPLVSFLFFFPFQEEPAGPYRSGIDLENQWHAEVNRLDGASPEQMGEALARLREAYAGSSVFWVDGTGRTRLELPEGQGLPDLWSTSYTVQFMKARYDADPFTVVAFVGGDPAQGFAVLQLPREILKGESAERDKVYGSRMTIGLLSVLAFFLFISWSFFYRIRRRLLRLEEAMTKPGPNGLPEPVAVKQSDEIGSLENAFNAMLGQLEESRAREQEEEKLRNQLIASLSHDLRTPLTTLRGHAFRLSQEPLTGQGSELVGHIDRKIDYMERLIENLFSYTLLTAGKYPYQPQQVELVRLVRTLFANWYPVFEQEGFEQELELPDTAVYWRLDPHWLERILDNYFQNMLRHARSGRYVAVRVTEDERGPALRLEDRGPGMGADSASKGAGMGLAIAALMEREMGLVREVRTGSGGTEIVLRQPSAGDAGKAGSY